MEISKFGLGAEVLAWGSLVAVTLGAGMGSLPEFAAGLESGGRLFPFSPDASSIPCVYNKTMQFTLSKAKALLRLTHRKFTSTQAKS